MHIPPEIEALTNNALPSAAQGEFRRLGESFTWNSRVGSPRRDTILICPGDPEIRATPVPSQGKGRIQTVHVRIEADSRKLITKPFRRIKSRDNDFFTILAPLEIDTPA